MFASLKSKIKEETGSDINKLTSAWRSGGLLSRNGANQAGGDSGDGVSNFMEKYLKDRTGGQIDHIKLADEYTKQLEIKLQERDAYWEKKIEEIKLSVNPMQGDEAAVAMSVARAAQAEARAAIEARDKMEEQLLDTREALLHSKHTHEKLDTVMEELESSRRERRRQSAEQTLALSQAHSEISHLKHELELIKASIPPGHQYHQFDDEESNLDMSQLDEETFNKLKRERAVLYRQLQEARLALNDVKTKWSGQIATLETQVGRLSMQAGEEGAERRYIENELHRTRDELINVHTQLDTTKTALVNSEAKVTRLNNEIRTLMSELKSLRVKSTQEAEKMSEIEIIVNRLTKENEHLNRLLENERRKNHKVHEQLECKDMEYTERCAELKYLNILVNDMRQDCITLEKKYKREQREKDEALLRNAQISQSVEMSKSDIRYQEGEINELRAKITSLENVIAQHKENEAECMLIKQAETDRLNEIQQLKMKIESLEDNENELLSTIQVLEKQVTDLNKTNKTQQSKVNEMKKALQLEIQNGKSDSASVEEADISRKYLKHVIMRFLTAHELEARQLTRALATLLRLSAQEEAILRNALPPSRNGLSTWFNFSPT